MERGARTMRWPLGAIEVLRTDREELVFVVLESFSFSELYTCISLFFSIQNVKSGF